MRIKLYVNMDGVLATLDQRIETLERIYEQGYFLNLKASENVVDCISLLAKDKTNFNVYILSSVLENSKYAFDEKNKWINKYLPFIDDEHRIFIKYGVNKTDYISDFKNNCVLLDDYAPSLVSWRDQGGISIQLINSDNFLNKNWDGMQIEYSLNPLIMSYKMKRIIFEEYVELNMKNHPETTELIQSIN